MGKLIIKQKNIINGEKNLNKKLWKKQQLMEKLLLTENSGSVEQK